MSRFRHFFMISTAAGMLGTAVPTHAADAYRWRDADGVVHFSDKPPANRSAALLKLRTPPPANPSPAEVSAEAARLRESSAPPPRSTPNATQEKLAQEKLAQEKRQRCLRSKQALSILEMDRPVYRDEDDLYRLKPPPRRGDAYLGKREYLDEVARKQEIIAQQELVSENCTGPLTPAERQGAQEHVLQVDQCEKAAADVKKMSQPESGSSPEVLSARRAFLQENCN